MNLHTIRSSCARRRADHHSASASKSLLLAVLSMAAPVLGVGTLQAAAQERTPDSNPASPVHPAPMVQAPSADDARRNEHDATSPARLGEHNPGQASEPRALDSMDAIALFDLQIPTVVTATRHEESIFDLPYSVSVITAEDLRVSGARSIADGLRLAAGVDVAELSSGQYAVLPRGFHSFSANKVLVLVDGRPIYDTLVAGTFWTAWPFQLEDIERIEVIRGPAGVAWGANAVNGVINIISKAPSEQLGLKLVGSAGSRGTYSGYVGYGLRDGKTSLRISGEVRGSDGFPSATGILNHTDDQYLGGTGQARIVMELNEREQLTLSAGSSVAHDNYPLPWYATILGAGQPAWETNSIGATWTRKEQNEGESSLRFYVNDFHTNSGPSYLDYRYQQVGAGLSRSSKVSETHKLGWGMDGRIDYTDAGNAEPYMLDKGHVLDGALGIYVQDDWRFAPRWSLTSGLRVEYDTYGGFDWAGRSALSYKLAEKELLFASVSHAFQMPPAPRRFMNFPVGGEIFRITGDRGLDAEQLWAYELGYHGQPTERLQLAVTGYWHDYHDLLASQFRLGRGGLFQLQQANGPQTGVYGLELEARYALTPRFLLLGNYTFERPDSSIDFTKIGAISPPENKFMLGTRWSPHDDWHLSSHLYFVDSVKAGNAAMAFIPQSIASYLRLDVRVEREFWKDRASVAAGVRNLLDGGHIEGGSNAVKNTEVPRTYFLEMRIAIK